MDKNSYNIEELFKSVLGDDEEMPEPKVWKAIENVLQNQDIGNGKKKYDYLKKAVFLFAFLIATSIYDYNRQHLPNENLHYQKAITNNASHNTIINGKSNAALITKEKELGSTSSDKTDTADIFVGIQRNNSGSVEPVKKFSVAISSKAVRSSVVVKSNFKSVLLPSVEMADKVLKDGRTTEIKKVVDQKIGGGQHEIALTMKTESRTTNLESDTEKLVRLQLSPLRILNSVDSFKNNLVAGDIKRKNNKQSPFSLSIFFSPDFASYRLQDNIPGDNLNEAIETEENEQHEFSSTVGAMLSYRIKNHWSIQSGLTYSNTNITVNPQFIYAGQDDAGAVKYILNTSSGYGYVLPSFSRSPAIGDSLYALSSDHTLQYLSLPVGLKYDIPLGKFTFSAMAGTAVHYLLKGKVETLVRNRTNNEPEVVNKLQGLKKVYFSGTASFGIDYLLSQKVAITFIPTYRFALNSINKEGAVKSYPNSLGFTTGLKFNF